MLTGILQGLIYFIQIIQYTLLIYCLLSWFMPPAHKIMRFLGKVTDPLLDLIRPVMFRIFPRMPMDLSALVLYFLLNLLIFLI
ncbi:MAG: YggT family protein, partial [Clostridia bacterium]